MKRSHGTSSYSESSCCTRPWLPQTLMEMVKQVHVKVGIKQLSPLFNERVTSFYITSLILSDVSMVLL